MARPVTDKAGNLYVLFVASTQAQNAAALLAGQPSEHVQPGVPGRVARQVPVVHRLHRVRRFRAGGTNTVQFGDIFNDIAIDGAGNLFVVGAGYIGTTPVRHDGEPLPVQVDHPRDHLERPPGGR